VLLCVVALTTGRAGHGFESCRGLRFLRDSPSLHAGNVMYPQLGGMLPIYTSGRCDAGTVGVMALP